VSQKEIELHGHTVSKLRAVVCCHKQVDTKMQIRSHTQNQNLQKLTKSYLFSKYTQKLSTDANSLQQLFYGGSCDRNSRDLTGPQAGNP